MFAMHYIRKHMTAIYPIMGDVNFDYLVKMVFARIYYKVAIFPL